MDMNKLPVTAVIPVYNRRATLMRAIESVLSQTLPVSEIIVVNDGSQEALAEFCREADPGIICIEMPENRGVSAARNLGISRASQDWIALLDSDDEWLPEKMERQWAYLSEHPDLTILQSEEIWIRHGKRVNPMKKHRKFGGDIFEQSLPLCIVSPSAVMFRKKVFSALGAFDETLPVCEDYDLWLRWSLHYPFGLLQEYGIRKYGGHEDQLSRSTANMDIYRIRSLNKLLADPQLSKERRNAVLTEMEKKLSIYLGGLGKRGKRDRSMEELQRTLFPQKIAEEEGLQED